MPAPAADPHVGDDDQVVSALFVGTFNLMVQAQFWSLANDLYMEEQGKRLFAIVGFGAFVGERQQFLAPSPRRRR